MSKGEEYAYLRAIRRAERAERAARSEMPPAAARALAALKAGQRPRHGDRRALVAWLRSHPSGGVST